VAQSYLFEATSLVQFGVQWMEQRFAARVGDCEASRLQ